MISQKEFYFVRHGQTDHNLLEGLHKGDHTIDIPFAYLLTTVIDIYPVYEIGRKKAKGGQQ